ncbi:fimbrial protein [Obesumbacterium proteus]|uniref:fimbrial protein n=1 Tax=Obesumbacterium proteus TaxID=82983 RepID=UPI00242BAC1A|nr:fimbrial protein [Obesumbacterium proteus]
MELKKYFFAGMATLLISPSMANAADGTITFNGMVTASACTAITGVSANGSAPTKNAIVTLPNVTASTLNNGGIGTYTGQTAFNIQLTGCQAIGTLNNVRTNFTTANTPAGDNYVMGNTAAGGSADVAVAILTSAGTQIDLNGGTAVDPGAALPLSSGTPGPIVMNYIAAYKPLTTSVTAGPVTGVADYVISYY